MESDLCFLKKQLEESVIKPVGGPALGKSISQQYTSNSETQSYKGDQSKSSITLKRQYSSNQPIQTEESTSS
jgi:hypothetical protein